MAKTLIHVWHSTSGEIVAIGRPISKAKCVPVGGEDQGVMEAEVDDDQIAELHRTHGVDIGRKALVRYAEGKK
jgi:hypothetical protein